MKVKFVIIDSGPIIKGSILENISEHAVIVPGVIREIKDVNTRQRIRNLPPYFLSIQVPSEQAIKHVKSVALKTGDMKVLSSVDIEVLAMAYEMQFIKTSDQIDKMFKNFTIEDDFRFSDDKEKQDFDDNIESDEDEYLSCGSDSDSEAFSDVEDLCKNMSDLQFTETNDNVTEYTRAITDDDGWITPENFEEMRKTNFGFEKNDDGLVSIEELLEVPPVGCLTTDYAMQNVLLHMHIPILSLDGMVIKEPRIFVSYCRACFYKYKKVDLFFCPHCGNDNIGKVPAKILENGDMKLFLKKDFQPNLRNKKFSIPTPKGGKHTDGTHYIYCSDQRIPDERPKKSKIVVDITENGQIPFIMHDFTTKSSLRGLHQDQSQKLRPTVPKGNKRHKRRRK